MLGDKGKGGGDGKDQNARRGLSKPSFEQSFGKPPAPPQVAKAGAAPRLAGIQAGADRVHGAQRVAKNANVRESIDASRTAMGEHEKYLADLAAVSEDDASSVGSEAADLTRFARMLRDVKAKVAGVSLEPLRDYLATCCVEDEIRTGERIRKQDVPGEFWTRLEEKRDTMKGKKVEAVLGKAGVRVSLARKLTGATETLRVGAEAAEATRGTGSEKEKEVAFYRYLFVVVARDISERAGTRFDKLRAAMSDAAKRAGRTSFAGAASAAGRRIADEAGRVAEGAKKFGGRAAEEARKAADEAKKAGVFVADRAQQSLAKKKERSGSTASQGDAERGTPPEVSNPTNPSRTSFSPAGLGLTGVKQTHRPINAPRTSTPPSSPKAVINRGSAPAVPPSRPSGSVSGQQKGAAPAIPPRPAGFPKPTTGGGSPKGKSKR